jgi:hypothetical protein
VDRVDLGHEFAVGCSCRAEFVFEVFGLRAQSGVGLFEGVDLRSDLVEVDGRAES